MTFAHMTAASPVARPTLPVFFEDEKTPVSGWLLAAACVVAIHAIVFGIIFFTRDETPDGVDTTPAVMIDLSPQAAAPPASDDVDTPPAPAPSEAKQPEETKPPTPDVTPPPDPVPPEAEPKPPETLTAPEAPLAPQPEAILPEEAKPAPPEPEKVEKPVEQVVKQEQQPSSEPAAAAMTKHIDAPPSEKTAVSAQSGAPTKVIAHWQSQLFTRLNMVKRCPGGASGAYGTATVGFAIQDDGTVTGIHLMRSSGSSTLDGEALNTVRRASPFPRPPMGFITLGVPIHFGC